jgi:5-formaminoimidazole-4-carboxamide-1-beta-D-ribofuranosyl 5'-monophosphate synthetase
MKKILFLAVLFVGISASAQSVGQDIKKGAKKVGNKTAEVASKGKAHITDQKYKDKTGPNGEVIYIDKHSKYYWIDKKGKKHYINENKLINAPKD